MSFRACKKGCVNGQVRKLVGLLSKIYKFSPRATCKANALLVEMTDGRSYASSSIICSAKVSQRCCTLPSSSFLAS
jgi:hypothetical protein